MSVKEKSGPRRRHPGPSFAHALTSGRTTPLRSEHPDARTEDWAWNSEWQDGHRAGGWGFQPRGIQSV